MSPKEYPQGTRQVRKAVSRLTCVLRGCQGGVGGEEQQHEGKDEAPTPAAMLWVVVGPSARRHPRTPAAHATPRPHLERVRKGLVSCC